MKLFKQRKSTSSRQSITPDSEVAEQVKQKKALIIVGKDFDERYVPNGYTKLKLKTPTDEFIGLIPSQALFYLDKNNLPGSNLDDALDKLGELYAEIEAANDVFGDSSRINVGCVDFALTVRNNYRDLCVNDLISGQSREKDEEARNAEYDEAETKRLCLGDSFVEKRMKAIASVATGKTLDEIVELGLNEVLGFEKTPLTEKITSSMFDKITYMSYVSHSDQHTKTMRCLGDSHYYLKDEFNDGQDGWDYDLRTMKRTRVDFSGENLRTIQELEGEISEYQKKHSGEPTSHDKNLTRMAINMKYGAGLDINPADSQNARS